MEAPLANADTETLRRDFPVSHALLVHDGLMTRQLIRFFGPVHAVQTGLERDGDTVTRWSTLHQTATGAALLHATLVIASQNLPDGLMDQLQSGNQLFGGLLAEAGVVVRMTDRVIYRAGPPGGVYAGSWGRRQRMLRAFDDVLLCDVDECLSDEAALHRLLIAPLADPAAAT